MNKEIIETIKNVKTSEELKDVASKNGYNLTPEEAQGYFDLYHNNGQVDEEELDNVTGGSSCIGGKSYSDDDHGWLIVGSINSCPGFVKSSNDSGVIKDCDHCAFVKTFNAYVLYCTMRKRWDDPYNDSVGTKRIKGANGRYWQTDGSDCEAYEPNK